MKARLFLAVGLLFASLSLAAQTRPIRLATTGHVPAAFTPNAGQWEGDFTLKTDIPGASTAAFFKGGVWSFAQRRPFDHTLHDPKQKERLEAMPKAFAWRIRFEGANGGAKALADGEAGAPANYLLGHRRATVQPRSEGRIADLYTQIDARLLYVQEQLRFDLEVRPGGDPSKLHLSYEGADIQLKEGLLRISTPYGAIYQTVPKAYQIRGRDTIRVEVRYRQEGQTISFVLGKYDRRLPLVIDPTLIFSTYSGSTADNWGSTATYADDGSMFSGGAVFSSGFPVTMGVVDTAFNTIVDMGILKYSPDGRQLRWATYMGGSGCEDPISLVADRQNRLYILGITGSSDLPMTPNGADISFNGGPRIDPMGYAFYNYYFRNGSDLSLTCLSPDGRRLVGATFLGGSGIDGLLKYPDSSALHRNYGDCFRGEVNLDAQGRVLVASHSLSPNFTNAVQQNGRLGADGQIVVLRLSPNLDTLLNRVAFGGSGLDAAYALAQDSAGNTFVCGGTLSTNFPATTGAFHTSYSGNGDGFLARIRADWSGVEAATYIGTSAYDQAYLVQVDNRGRPCVVGQTSGNYPKTPGAWTDSQQGGQFIHAFTGDLSRTAFVTAYGGPTPNLVITAFLIDVCNQLYIAGWGGVTNQANSNYMGGSTRGLPATPGAVQDSTDGSDFHVLVLDPEARALSYATFFGAYNLQHGEHVDGGTSRFDKRSVVYQSVCGCGGSILPTTPDVWSPTNNSNNCNNAAFKFDFSPLVASFRIQRTQGCAPFTVDLHNKSQYATSFSWRFDTVGTSSSADTALQFTFNRPGRYVIRLRAYNTTNCFRKDSAEVVVNVTGFPPGPFVRDTTLAICTLGAPLPLQTPLPAGSYQVRWTPGRYLSDSTAANPTATPQSSQQYSVTIRDTAGCQTSRQVKLVDRRLQASTTLGDTSACLRYQGQYTATSFPGGNIRWWVDSIRSNAQVTATANFDMIGAGTHWLHFRIDNDTTCPGFVVDSAKVVLHAPRPADLYTDSILTICPGDTLRLKAPESGRGYRYGWEPVGFPATNLVYVDSLPTAVLSGALPGTQIRFSLRQNGCLNERTYALRQDTLTAPYSFLSRYDSCQNRYTIRLAGTNSSASTYRFYSGTSLLGSFLPTQQYERVLPGAMGSSLNLRVEAVRRGCTAETLFSLPLPDHSLHPKAGFSLSTSYPGCSGPAVVRILTSDASAGQIAYRLDGERLDQTTIPLTDSLPHTLWQIASLGTCRDSLSQTFQHAVLNLPNVLTPNGDGKNDALLLPASDDAPWQLEVINRWGHLVRRWDDYPSGAFPPSGLEAGTYYYRLWRTDLGDPCRGWIEVVGD